MGYDDNGNWMGMNQESDNERRKNLEYMDNMYKHKPSSSGNRGSSSGGGCVVALLILAGGLASASYGLHQLLATFIW